jgi:hypothetical protein
MKVSPFIVGPFAIMALCVVTSAKAQSQVSRDARIAARQELELAKLDLQNYWQVEYPRQRRELNAAIELADEEIRSIDEQQNILRPFTRFTLDEPFPLTWAELRVCRKAADIRLNNLLAERNSLIRFHGDQFRILELRVQAARQRVVELEASDEVARTQAILPAPQPQ